MFVSIISLRSGAKKLFIDITPKIWQYFSRKVLKALTDRLYYTDSHIDSFSALVLSCSPAGNGFAAVLDRTAFFPEGGGQPGDVGTLGGAEVFDTREEGGEVVHYLRSPLAPGSTVQGRLDRGIRFRRMQNHSGEHIVSGLIYREYGFSNVGFHMGEDDVTVDFNGELGRAELDHIETLANIAVCENRRVRAWFPDPSSLSRIKYRSKLDLSENVRLVRIEGYDTCACCAPHVKRTGEIGLIKLLDFARHRGGVRVHMLCGLDALEHYRMCYGNNASVSALLSAKQSETPDFVRKTLDELERSRRAFTELKRDILKEKIASLGAVEGNLCLFEDGLDGVGLRELVNAGMDKCGGVCAAFSADGGRLRYVIGSRTADLRKHAAAINRALSGAGGGSPGMIQGSASASREEIKAFFDTARFD